MQFLLRGLSEGEPPAFFGKKFIIATPSKVGVAIPLCHCEAFRKESRGNLVF